MKEAASSLSLSLSLLNSRHVRIHSDLLKVVRVEKRGGQGIVCTGHDVCLLTFTNYPQLALQMLKHMRCMSVCVCAYLLGAILNVRMFKAT